MIYRLRSRFGTEKPLDEKKEGEMVLGGRLCFGRNNLSRTTTTGGTLSPLHTFPVVFPTTSEHQTNPPSSPNRTSLATVCENLDRTSLCKQNLDAIQIESRLCDQIAIRNREIPKDVAIHY